MDFEALKESIKKIQITQYEKQSSHEKASELIDGYYSFPFSGDGFKGQIIDYRGSEFNALFQVYSDGHENKFRNWFERYDDWLATNAHPKVQANWEFYVNKALLKKSKQEGLL